MRALSSIKPGTRGRVASLVHLCEALAVLSGLRVASYFALARSSG